MKQNHISDGYVHKKNETEHGNKYDVEN
jgi:hypothetical protein